MSKQQINIYKEGTAAYERNRAETAEYDVALLTEQLAASQQRVAELEAALKAIGNMAYTALYIVPDIRDRDLGSLEHACQMILAKIREFDEEDGPAGGGE